MPGMTPFQLWLWVLSVIARLAVCWLLFYKGHFRRFPVFTAYIVLNLGQSAFLFVVYSHSGFASPVAFRLAWTAEAITTLARVFAIVELLRLVLKPYRGIWALGWPLLTGALLAVLSYAAVDAVRSPGWAIIAADRGFDFAFAVFLLLTLGFVRYYPVPLHPIYKALLGGFCFASCIVVLKTTLIQALFLRYLHHFAYYQQINDSMTLVPTIAVYIVWAVTLRKPLPAPGEQPELLPAAVYRQVSPEVNTRLRRLNERLLEFRKVRDL